MTKEREDEVEEFETTEGTPADDQPEILVKDQDGQPVVEVRPGSRKEERERRRADEVRKIIEETQRPLRDQLTWLVSQRQSPAQQPAAVPVAVPPGVDPEWRKLVQDQTRIVALVRASNSAEDIQKLEEEWHNAEYRKGEIIALKTTKAMREQLARDNPTPEDPVHKMARSEFLDVLNYGPDATAYASGLFLQEKAKASRERRPFDEMATHRAVLLRTAEDFSIRPKALPARSSAQQGRFSSPGSSSTGAGAGSGPTRALTKPERTMAIAFADRGVPEDKAYAAWSKMMGPEYFRET
jgi:hypothetical protein